jgi:hypothetical protein
MTKEAKALVTEIAQVKLYLRRIERDALKVRNIKVNLAIDEACKSLDVAVLAMGGGK